MHLAKQQHAASGLAKTCWALSTQQQAKRGRKRAQGEAKPILLAHLLCSSSSLAASGMLARDLLLGGKGSRIKA